MGMHPVERREARAWLEQNAEPGPDNPLPDFVVALLKEQKLAAEGAAQKAEILSEEYGVLSRQIEAAKLIIDTFEAEYPKEYRAVIDKLTPKEAPNGSGESGSPGPA